MGRITYGIDDWPWILQVRASASPCKSAHITIRSLLSRRRCNNYKKQWEVRLWTEKALSACKLNQKIIYLVYLL